MIITVISGLVILLLGRFLGWYRCAGSGCLIEWFRPQVELLSVAAGDRDGLPDPEALQATAGFNLLRTDRHGWIELSTDS